MKMKPHVTPLLTVDIIIVLTSTKVVRNFGNYGIVLIKRKNPPHGWALPGGFVDVGETVEHAAAREAKEETGLTVNHLSQLGCYSDPRRDPRGHTVSIAFMAESKGIPKAADDAAYVKIFLPQNLPHPICFDHAKILRDWRRANLWTYGSFKR